MQFHIFTWIKKWLCCCLYKNADTVGSLYFMYRLKISRYSIIFNEMYLDYKIENKFKKENIYNRIHKCLKGNMQ